MGVDVSTALWMGQLAFGGSAHVSSANDDEMRNHIAHLPYMG